jgi:hypothetical protein
VKKFVALVGSALSSPSMYATASGRFAFQMLGSLRSRLLGSGSAAGRQEQDFKNLLAALGSLPPSMATVGVLAFTRAARVVRACAVVCAVCVVHKPVEFG